MKSFILSLFVVSFISSSFFLYHNNVIAAPATKTTPETCNTAGPNDPVGFTSQKACKPKAGSLPTETGLNEEGDAFKLVSTILRYVFGFTGLIVFCLFIYGGFKYMTSGDSKDGSKDAVQIITNAIIGLIIIFMSYALANTILSLVF